MARPRPVVSLSDVSLVLDGKRVLSHVDWEVMPGENWVVIGPNGAGKTSLLSIINGYRWPSSGEVSVLGRRFGEADLRELRTETGLVSSYLDSMIGGDEKVVDLVVSGKFGSTRLWRKVEASDVARATSLLKAVGCVEHRGKVALRALAGGEAEGRDRQGPDGEAEAPRPRRAVRRARHRLQGELPRRPRAPPLEEGGPSFIEVTHRTEDIPPGFTHALLLREGRVVGSGEIGTTLTSRKLTRCLGTEVELKSWGGRYYMIAAKKR